MKNKDTKMGIIRDRKWDHGATYLRDLSAVSVATGGSQVTITVSFPGSAALSLDAGHLIFGGSVSEINRGRHSSVQEGKPSMQMATLFLGSQTVGITSSAT